MTCTASALSLLLMASSAALTASCGQTESISVDSPAPAPAPAAQPPGWEAEVSAWKQARFERLQRPDGWLTLVGLGWLKVGDNAIGSDPASAVILPAANSPARLGTLQLVGGGKTSQVTFVAAPGV
ncbi:MAG: hypothetical protein ABIU84_14725, partial [Thermoanaerobaculia bacterium]